MNNKFIQKYNKEVVTYSDIVKVDSYSDEVDFFSRYLPNGCTWYVEVVTEYGIKKCIPILDFMNVYEPYSTKTEEMLTAVYNTVQDENNVPQQENKDE